MAIQRTAEDVAQMQDELYHLRYELDETKHKLTIAETERGVLKIENAILAQKADDRLTKLSRVETMVTGLANALFSQLKEIREEREIAAAVRRQVQEDNLGVGSEIDRAPAFMAPRHVVERAQIAEVPEKELARTEQLRGAAEHIAPPVLANRPGRIDHTLADRDPRLPRPEGLMRETVPTNEDNLRDISGSMKTRR